MPFTYIIDLYTMVAKFTYAYSGQRISANVVLPDCCGSNTATTGYPFRASRNVLSRFPAIIILSIRLMPSLFLELLFLSLSYYSIQGVIFKLNHGFTPEFGIFRKPPYTRFHNHATLKKHQAVNIYARFTCKNHSASFRTFTQPVSNLPFQSTMPPRL